jgi:hypothetical protein
MVFAVLADPAAHSTPPCCITTAPRSTLLDAATTPPQSFLDQIVAAWRTPPAELGGQPCYLLAVGRGDQPAPRKDGR